MTTSPPAPERSPRAGEAPASRFPGWIVAAAVAIYAVALVKPLAIDEESYRWLGTVVGWGDPYDWSREWQGRQGWAYAHPPLHLWWMRLWSGVAALPLARLSGLPFVVLWATAAALWIRRTTHHPEVAGVAFLTSSTVVLGLQDSLMIDLPYVAWTTAALALYREGFSDRRPGWHLAAGLAFGAAIETKYPAALLAPIFVWHGWRAGVSAAFWAPALAVVGGVEGWLWALHGEPHPMAAWASREVISRGPLGERVLGVLARGALLPSALALVYVRPVHAAAGLGVAAAALAWARPASLEAGGLVFLLVCATLGAMALTRGVGGLLASPLRRRKGDHHDPLLLGGAIVVTYVGVAAVHNFASARYLLPAAVPLAILLGRAAEDVAHGKAVQLGVSVGSGVLALLLALADAAYCAAGVDAAKGALVVAAAHDVPPGRFLAEWSARAELEAAGWRRLADPGDALPGDRVIVVQGSGGRVPEAWEPLAAVEIEGRFPLRVVDPRAGIGLYAETLGPLPFGLSGHPLETAVVYEVR